MADFCKQCSIDNFGEDFRELAGITTQEAWNDGKAAVVLCEGCGPIQVDPDRLRDLYYSRWAWNAWAFPWYARHKQWEGDRFIPERQGFF